VAGAKNSINELSIAQDVDQSGHIAYFFRVVGQFNQFSHIHNAAFLYLCKLMRISEFVHCWIRKVEEEHSAVRIEFLICRETQWVDRTNPQNSLPERGGQWSYCYRSGIAQQRLQQTKK
jgi:hypothetical protein